MQSMAVQASTAAGSSCSVGVAAGAAAGSVGLAVATQALMFTVAVASIATTTSVGIITVQRRRNADAAINNDLSLLNTTNSTSEPMFGLTYAPTTSPVVPSSPTLFEPTWAPVVFSADSPSTPMPTGFASESPTKSPVLDPASPSPTVSKEEICPGVTAYEIYPGQLYLYSNSRLTPLTLAEGAEFERLLIDRYNASYGCNSLYSRLMLDLTSLQCDESTGECCKLMDDGSGSGLLQLVCEFDTVSHCAGCWSDEPLFWDNSTDVPEARRLGLKELDASLVDSSRSLVDDSNQNQSVAFQICFLFPDSEFCVKWVTTSAPPTNAPMPTPSARPTSSTSTEAPKNSPTMGPTIVPIFELTTSPPPSSLTVGLTTGSTTGAPSSEPTLQDPQKLPDQIMETRSPTDLPTSAPTNQTSAFQACFLFPDSEF